MKNKYKNDYSSKNSSKKSSARPSLHDIFKPKFTHAASIKNI